MPNAIPPGAEWFLDEFDADRFWDRVSFHGGQPYLEDPLSQLGADAGECWPWMRGTDEDGYARFIVFGKQTQAHRIAYRDFGHKLTDDEHIDHLCRNHSCVRPSHLEAVPQAVNVDRGLRGRPANPTCKHGHEYTPENTGWQSRGRTKFRVCRACRANYRRAREQRRSAA